MSEVTRTASATLPASVEPGTVLGSWEIVALLGKGAMGSVWRARHVRLGRAAAVKVLLPEYVVRQDIVQRFFREARVVNEIDHPNIVEVTDFVEEPGLAYLVMELLEGDSLRALAQRKGRRYPRIARIVGILRQVCDALEAAHGKGVVHRDLKPDNVFVVQRDGADFVKVLDFGVARLLDDGDHAATMSGMIIGTPSYMSPEQAMGRPVDRATDIWAAGVVLFELLAGEVPLSAPSFVELAVALREKPPKPLPKKTPRGERIPPWLAAVVARCLEKKPEDRYRSMAQLRDALAGPVPRSRAGRKLLAAAGAAAAIAAAAAGVRYGLPRGAGDLGRSATELGRSAVEQVKEQTAKVAGALSPPAATPSPAPPAPAATPAATPAPAAPATATPPAPPARAPKPPPKPAAAKAAQAAPKPAPKPKPAPQPTVELRIKSTPPGATVIRLDTGKRLGKTPLKVSVPRKAATVWLELRLADHAPIQFEGDLREDVVANVTLHHARKARH